MKGGVILIVQRVEHPRNILDDILGGLSGAKLKLNFLSLHNKTDMSILKVTKVSCRHANDTSPSSRVQESLEDRYSIYHSAITFTNAYANCGTTSDRFLRENLDWLGRASNWAKFSATAGLGLIHRGSWINGIRVVKPYLPGGSAPSKFSEGGALFALGLIYTGAKQGAEEDLRKALSEGNDPVVQHGAALGLGVSAIATADGGESAEGRVRLADCQIFTRRSRTHCSKITLRPEKLVDTLWVWSCSARQTIPRWTRC